jgi:hypothetical protein
VIKVAHPGSYYGVLRSTTVVQCFFRRQNGGDVGSCDKS